MGIRRWLHRQDKRPIGIEWWVSIKFVTTEFGKVGRPVEPKICLALNHTKPIQSNFKV